MTSVRDVTSLGDLADADLLSLLVQHDLGALEEIYDRHLDAVWRVAAALAPHTAAAEDAVAAAFGALWRNPQPHHPTMLSSRLLASVTREARAGVESH